MSENLNSNNLENDAFDLNNEDSDFQDLINRLKEMKSTIALFCLLYTSPSPRDVLRSRMPSSA